MRIGRALGLSAEEQSHLFYALLLKDAGCSSNAARVFQLFGGDEQKAKRGVWMRDWRKLREQVAYVLDYVEPEGSLSERIRRFAVLADQGAGEPPRAVPGALRPRRRDRPHAGILAGHRARHPLHGRALGRRRLSRRPAAATPFPLIARIIGLAQVAEIFASDQSPERAVAVARQRRGSWFDPQIVNAFASIANDASLWEACALRVARRDRRGCGAGGARDRGRRKPPRRHRAAPLRG